MTTTYKDAFPNYASTIPERFLQAPWADSSWEGDACPSFSMRLDNGCNKWARGEVHVYVDEESPDLRDTWVRASDGKSKPCPRFTVRFTDDLGFFPPDATPDPRDFDSDSLVEVLGRVATAVLSFKK
jgi:hypothetical protein